MGRPAKPWKRRGRDGWWAKINGQAVKLADTEREAWVELHRILGRPGRRGPKMSVMELIDLWLDYTRRRVKAVTWRNYQFYGQSFVNRWRRIAAETICEDHVDKWVDGHPDWDGCRPLAMTIIRMCWRWGRRKRHIATNELADMRSEGIRVRKSAESGDVKKLAGGFFSEEFADLYRFMVAVGCRPGEARTLRAELIDLDDRVAIVNGKGGLRPVVLPDAAIAPLRRAMKRHPSGFVFRAKGGEPWGMSGLSSQVRRARRRLGLPENLVAYHARGDFASRAHAAGAELGDIAKCLGHNDTTRLSILFKHYLDASRDRLRGVADMANKARAGKDAKTRRDRGRAVALTARAASPPPAPSESPSPPGTTPRKPPRRPPES